MLFGRGGPSFRGLFATHPPLEQRILALDPSFKPGEYLPSGHALPAEEAAEDGLAASALAPDAGTAPRETAGEGFGLEAAGRVGAPDAGAALRAAIPEALDHAAHSREAAFLLVLALTLSPDEATLKQQRALLERQLGTDRARRCLRLNAELAELDRRLWLPLLEIAVPALKQRPAAQLHFLSGLAERLARADDRLDLFEYALLRTLGAYLGSDGPARGAAQGRPSRMPADEAVRTVLATVAAEGQPGADAALAAYRAGLGALDAQAGADDSAVLEAARAHGRLARLDAALDALAERNERAQRQVLTAVLATIRHDRRVAIEELELFRAIAASLGCPMPPAATIR